MLDLDRDADQLIGTIDKDIVDRLWPGFVAQNYDVCINPVYLRRHLQKSADWRERVPALNQNGDLIAVALSQPYVFLRYEDVRVGEVGLTVYVEVRDEPEPTQYMALGILVRPPKSEVGKDGKPKPNYVTTLIPPMSAKKITSKLERHTHCWPDGRVTYVSR